MIGLCHQFSFVCVRSVLSILVMSTLSWAAVPVGKAPVTPSHAPRGAAAYESATPAKSGFLPVLVYGAWNCSYCTKVKEIFEKNKIPFTYIDVTQNDRAYKEMQEKTSKTTVPQIFVGGRWVGSYMDVAWLSDEDLHKLVRRQKAS